LLNHQKGNTKVKGKKKDLYNFYKDPLLEKEISITASGVPCYSPRQIKENISEEKPFLFQIPGCV